MAFLNETGLQTLTNKLVQGDAIKVASHRGKNVKEVIDNIQRECENVALPNTMTLENRVNEFKVGQGRDVDVSGDVEEGKINVELQGKTWQNLAYSTQYLFYTNKLECFTVERDKDNNHIRVVAKEDMTSGYMYFNCGQVSKTLIKPNTTYTAIIKKNPTVTNMRLMLSDGNALNISAVFSNFDSLGRCKFTTNDMIDSTHNIIYINNKYSIKKGDTFEVEDLIILEGDYTQTPVEELPKYFEGIKSSFEDGIVEVEVQGKNLLNKNNIIYNKWIDSTNGLLTGGSNTRHYMDYTKIEGGRTIVLSGCTPTACYVYSDIGVCIGERSWQGSFSKPQKLPIEAKYIRFTFDSTVAFENMQLEYSTTSTTYEPYYKKKISFNIGEPLRSLPNGICDEIRNNNGQWELVRKIGKIVLDGSEAWINNGPWSGGDYQASYIRMANKGGNKLDLFCDRFVVDSQKTNSSNQVTNECCFGEIGNGVLYLIISKQKLNTPDMSGLKQWLSENPTTVYYELATYIVTPIDPIEFNISQGATVSINSDISPVSTYDAVLNRAGQIEQGISLIADLRNRVNTLESIYDSNLLATQYKLDNLKLNYELEREED